MTNSPLNSSGLDVDDHIRSDAVAKNDTKTDISSPEEAPPRTLNDAPLDLLPVTFVGRQTELDFISETFNTFEDFDIPCRCVVCGSTGVGKTKLALRYAKVSFNLHRYSHVFWASAATTEKLIQGIAQILDLIGHPDRYLRDLETKTATAINWLEGERGYDIPDWLFVIDDVHEDTVDVLLDSLPRHNAKGNLLFTTRTMSIAETLAGGFAGHRTLALGTLSLEDSASLFFSHAGVDPAKVMLSQLSYAEGLCKRVGCLPLAVVQAASHAKQTCPDLDHVFELDKDIETSQALEWDNPLTASEKQAVTAVLMKQLEWTKNESLNAYNLLKLLSFLNPDAVPVDIIIEGAQNWSRKLNDPQPAAPTHVYRNGLRFIKKKSPPQEPDDYLSQAQMNKIRGLISVTPEFQSLVTLIVSPDEFQGVLQQLHELGLITHRTNAGESSLQIHELIQAMVRESAQKYVLLYRDWLQFAVSLVCLAFDRIEDHESRRWWSDCEKFIPHLRSLREECDRIAHPSIDLAAADIAISAYLLCRFKYAEAETLCKDAFAIHETILGADHPCTLRAIHSLSRVWLDEGMYSAAAVGTQRAFDGRMKYFGPSHKSTLASMFNLALIYRYQERYAKSEEYYTRVLAIEQKKLGTRHSDTLSTMKNLGSLYKSQGRYADAEKLYERSLEGYEKTLGADHPVALWKVERLASLYQVQARYDAAEELLMQALTNMKKHLGADHPWTVDLAESLFKLYQAQGLGCEAYMIYT